MVTNSQRLRQDCSELNARLDYTQTCAKLDKLVRSCLKGKRKKNKLFFGKRSAGKQCRNKGAHSLPFFSRKFLPQSFSNLHL